MNVQLIILSLLLHSIASNSQSVEDIGKSVYDKQVQRLQYRNRADRDSVFKAFDFYILEIINNQLIRKGKVEDIIWQSEQMKLDNIRGFYTDFFMSMLKYSSYRHLVSFSYDLLSEGDTHLYRNYVLVKGPDGKFEVFEKTGLNETSEFGYTDISSLNCNGRLIHILIGYATDDKTLHSQRIRFFEENDDGIFECFNCLNEGEMLTITSRLNQFPAVKVDDESKTLTFKEFIYDDISGEYLNEHKEIRINLCECY